MRSRSPNHSQLCANMVDIKQKVQEKANLNKIFTYMYSKVLP